LLIVETNLVSLFVFFDAKKILANPPIFVELFDQMTHEVLTTVFKREFLLVLKVYLYVFSQVASAV